MKTLKLVFVLLCVLCSSSLFAQRKKTSFGIEAGMNISNYAKADYDPRVGFAGGISVQHFVDENWALDIGLMYVMGGMRAYSLSGSDKFPYKVDVNFKTDFITVPILVKGYIPNTGLNFNFGPQATFLVKNSAASSEQGNFDHMKLGGIHKVGLGLVGGVGYDFDSGVFLDFQMNRTLTKLYPERLRDDNYFYFGFTFLVGVRF